MVEKFIVNPSEVRGLGDVVSPKSTHDFLDYNGIVTSSTDSDYGTVFTESYRSGASLVLENSRSIGSGVGSFTVKATLKNSSNTAISGATVHLVVNGNDVTGTTNNNGVVNFTVSTVSGVRKYSLTAYYIGDISNGGCFASSSVYVNGDLEEFNLLADKSVVQVDDECNVFATLLDEDGEGLAMQEVMFYQEWTPGIKLGVEANPIQSGTGIDLSAQLVDTTDGSLIREAGHTVNFYIEAETITTLTLTSNKSVLSYADSDTCTLTATYTENDTGVSGKTVEIYKGSTKLGNATDNGDGTYSYSLASTGVGDISLTAKVDSLTSNSVSIEDCYHYDKCDTNKTSNYNFARYDRAGTQSLSFDTDHYLVTVPHSTSITSFYTTPLIDVSSSSKYELSFLSYTNRNYTDDTYNYEQSGFVLVNQTNADILYIQSNKTQYSNVTKFYRKLRNGTLTDVVNTTDSSANYRQVWLKHKLTINGVNFTYEITKVSDNTTVWSYTGTFELTSGNIGIHTGMNSALIQIKEIKVKPLF